MADVQKLRIDPRRKSLAASKMPMSKATSFLAIQADIVAKNEAWFASDVNFLEAVMCDKFNFRRVNINTAVLSLEPTAIGRKMATA